MKTIFAIILLFFGLVVAASSAENQDLFRSEKYKFRLIYPSGWEHRPIKDPRIVTKGEKNGVYVNVFAMGVPEFTGNAHNLSQSDIAAILQSDRPAGTLLKYEKQYLDNEPAMMVTMRATFKTLDIEATIVGLHYYVIKNKTLFTVSGSTLEKDFSASLPIIRRVLSTFKFEDNLY